MDPSPQKSRMTAVMIMMMIIIQSPGHTARFCYRRPGLYHFRADHGASLRNNYWIYDPNTDLWRSSDTEDDFDYTPFEGSARTKAICFSTGKRGIITTGGSSGYYYDDTWELHPYEWEEDD